MLLDLRLKVPAVKSNNDKVSPRDNGSGSGAQKARLETVAMAMIFVRAVVLAESSASSGSKNNE